MVSIDPARLMAVLVGRTVLLPIAVEVLCGLFTVSLTLALVQRAEDALVQRAEEAVGGIDRLLIV